MLSKKTYNYTTGQLGTSTGTISYAYDSQWKDKLASYNGQSITYNSIGNPINYMGATLTWEGRNLTSYTKDSVNITYEYDENGLRYRKKLKDSSDGYELTENYIWNDGKLISIVITDTDDVNMIYKYLYNESDEPVGYIMFEADGSIFANCYYLKNMQGDITGIVNSSGSIIVKYSYDVFGRKTVDYCTNDSLIKITRMIYSMGNPFGYRGYCYDADSGFYYLQSRYYDPNTGRFINADDTSYLNATGTVLGCNLFAYCENDPVDYIDPQGNYSATKALKYAKKWWNSYNPMYKQNSQDCANFVSQCLFAGELSYMTGIGKYGWHHYVIYGFAHYDIYGRLVSYQPTVWQISNAWGIAPDLYKYLVNTRKCKKIKIKSAEALDKAITKKKFSKGDVAFFAGNTGIYHAVIIGTIVNKKNNKNVYFFAHTSSRNGYDTKSNNSYGFKEVLNTGNYIYIVNVK